MYFLLPKRLFVTANKDMPYHNIYTNTGKSSYI